MRKGRRDFVGKLGAATTVGAFALTGLLNFAFREPGLAEPDSGSSVKYPPLFENPRPAWEIKFTDARYQVQSVMPGESDKTFYDPLIRRKVARLL